jgi:hypothetical protein
MIVRLEVHYHGSPQLYWQLKRCQVQRGAMMEDVSDPAFFRPIQFKTLEETVRHAKRATFTYLEKKQHKEMPDQIDWRIVEDARIFPCPTCQQPLYQKAKLGRTGNMLDLNDWGCPRCKKTVTLKTDDLVPSPDRFRDGSASGHGL